MSGATASPIGQIFGIFGVCQYDGVKSHVKWENFILSKIVSNFLRYVFQFLKLQFPTKILALSIKKKAKLYDVAFSRTLFIDRPINSDSKRTRLTGHLNPGNFPLTFLDVTRIVSRANGPVQAVVP